MSMNQNLSSLIDGELKAADINAMLAQLSKDKDLQRQWRAAMNARAVLREEYIADVSEGFADKVAASINLEAAIDAPANLLGATTQANNVVAFPSTAHSSNKLPAIVMLAAAASLAAVTFLNVNPIETDSLQQSQLAVSPGSNDQSTDKFLAAEQELQALVVAHGEFSSMAGLNGLAAYAKIVNADSAK